MRVKVIDTTFLERDLNKVGYENVLQIIPSQYHNRYDGHDHTQFTMIYKADPLIRYVIRDDNLHLIDIDNFYTVEAESDEEAIKAAQAIKMEQIERRYWFDEFKKPSTYDLNTLYLNPKDFVILQRDIIKE